MHMTGFFHFNLRRSFYTLLPFHQEGRRTMQEGRTVFAQVWHVSQRCEDANLDRHLRLRSHRHLAQTAAPAAQPLHDSTDSRPPDIGAPISHDLLGFVGVREIAGLGPKTVRFFGQGGAEPPIGVGFPMATGIKADSFAEGMSGGLESVRSCARPSEWPRFLPGCTRRGSPVFCDEPFRSRGRSYGANDGHTFRFGMSPHA